MNEPVNNNNHKTRKGIWIVTILFLLCAIAYLIYWLIWGQFSETTNDTYVNGNLIIITPQEKGIVTQIWVDNTQMVEEGQLILEIDPHDYEIALEKAEADLASSVRQVVQMFIKVEELKAKVEASYAGLIRANLDFVHREALVEDGSVSREDFEHSQTTLMGAFAMLTETEREYQRAYAEIQNTTIETHPRVEQNKSKVRKAYLALHRCRVVAPTRGIITQRRAQVGQWVKAETPLMALVPADQMWVDANFREVSLKYFRIGQPVEMYADMYGSSLKFHGTLVGLNPGTGSVFSILPPQNATGNWIKIIQRIPVKISLDPEELRKNPLVLGLSMTATVDTHERNGLQLPRLSSSQPLYVSHVYQDELRGVEIIIDKIIADNKPKNGTEQIH